MKKLYLLLITSLLLYTVSRILFSFSSFIFHFPSSIQSDYTFAQEETPTVEPNLEYIGSEKCSTCHNKIFKDFSQNAHSKLRDELLPKGYSGCEACHGPASEHINGGKKDYIINPKSYPSEKINEICAKCHFKESNPPQDEWKKFSKKYWNMTLHYKNNLSCLSCHKLHSTVPKSLSQPSETLCFTCHVDKKGKTGDFVHKPVANGNCKVCHNPHGTRVKHMVIEDLSKGCLNCHTANDKFRIAHGNYPVEKQKKYNCSYCHNPHSQDVKNKLLKKFMHKPFESKNCNMCHKSTNEDPFALKKQVKDLCGMCHKNFYDEFAKKKNIHPPVKEGFCLMCHNPHLSDYKKGLTIDKIEYLCYNCHYAVQDKLEEQEYKHKPVKEGNCLGCHTPHASNYSKLLPKDVISICYNCHPIKGTFVHPVGPNITMEKTDEKFDIYCTTCHIPHSSENMKLLMDEQTKVCRKCHKM